MVILSHRRKNFRTTAGGGGGGDPYWANVVLLVQSPQTNNSTSIVDSSLVGRTLTIGGNVKSTTSQAKFGTASIDFPGVATDRISWSSFNLTGDFTIEFFYRQESRPAGYVIMLYGAGSWYNILLDYNSGKSDGSVGCYFDGAVGGNAAGLSLDTWYYYAMTRSGSTITCYINGVSKFSVTKSGNIPWTGLSNFTFPSYSFDGKFDQLRITDGVVRDVSTVPTAAFPTSL